MMRPGFTRVFGGGLRDDRPEEQARADLAEGQTRLVRLHEELELRYLEITTGRAAEGSDRELREQIGQLDRDIAVDRRRIQHFADEREAAERRRVTAAHAAELRTRLGLPEPPPVLSLEQQREVDAERREQRERTRDVDGERREHRQDGVPEIDAERSLAR